MIYFLPVMIALAFLAACAGFCWGTREDRTPLARLDGPAPLPYEVVPFPADTRPLLLLSEQAAAQAALELEIRQLAREAERRIGRVRP